MKITAEHLSSLGHKLRNANFRIGPAHHIDALHLVGKLEESGGPADPDELAAYLAPIYCANADQQAQFPRLLKAALDVDPGPDVEHDPGPPLQVELPAKGWLLRTVLGLVLIASVAVPAYLFLPHSIEGVVIGNDRPAGGARVRLWSGASVQERLTGDDGRFVASIPRVDLPAELTVEKPGYAIATKTVDSFDAEPHRIELSALMLPPAPAEPLGFERVYKRDPKTTPAPTLREEPIWRSASKRWALVLAPGLVALLWSTYWLVRRRAWLARLPNQTPKNVRQLSSGARRSLSLVLDTGLAWHELRRRQWVSSAELNVEATLRSVLQDVGAPQLVFGSRIEPEYLALVDETSQVDHLARLGDELMVSLEKRDVWLKRFFFRENPLFCEAQQRNGSSDHRGSQ